MSVISPAGRNCWKPVDVSVPRATAESARSKAPSATAAPVKTLPEPTVGDFKFDTYVPLGIEEKFRHGMSGVLSNGKLKSGQDVLITYTRDAHFPGKAITALVSKGTKVEGSGNITQAQGRQLAEAITAYVDATKTLTPKQRDLYLELAAAATMVKG